MRIERFWARGFRSLRDVDLDGLGPFVVLYGKNGSGKSNLLLAIRLLVDVLKAQTCLHAANEACSGVSTWQQNTGRIQRQDLFARGSSREITLGARFVSDGEGKSDLAFGDLAFPDLTVEIRLDMVRDGDLRAFTTRLESGGKDLREALPKGSLRDLQILLSETIPQKAYTLIGAERFLGDGMGKVSSKGSNPPTWHRAEGGLALRLLRAQIDRRPQIRKRLADLRSLLEGPPLRRPAFFPVEDEQGQAALQERLPDPNPEGVELPVDFAGLGIVQIYVILAQAMLADARAVAIEEPEAHLHAPTTGLHLRELLLRLVNEQHIDQLFLATHSNVFDLDESGFWDVRFEDGETKIAKRPLDEIDRHLYDPGPTLHAFKELLKISEPDRVMFRTAGGAPVTAAEMLEMLHLADPVALEYLQDLHRAAVDVVGLRARRKAAGGT